MSIDERIARFEKLKAQFPENEQPRWSLATALAEAERFEQAVKEFRELVTMKPDYCVAFLRLGASLMELEKYEDAIEALEEGRQLALEQHHTAPYQEAEMLISEAREEL